MNQTRFKCLVTPCHNKYRDFSLLTLYEHLSYHLYERGYTEHFEYKCVTCNAYFTNKVFMVRHKMETGKENHKIERLPDIDLEKPQENEKLKKAVCTLTDDYLRSKFKVASSVPQDGMIELPQANCPGTPRTPRTPSRPCASSYTPRTPNMLIMTPPRTPTRYGDNSSADFSNCFANATPARPNNEFGNTPESSQFLSLLKQLITPPINHNMPTHWQQAAYREALGLPREDCGPQTPMRSHIDDNDSYDNFYGGQRGGYADENYSNNRGGRSFRSDNPSSHGRNRSDDGLFSRGQGGRGGDRGGRGSDRGGRGGFRGDRDRDRGRSGFRGGDRGNRGCRGGGRSRGGDKDGRSFSRSRSRSPISNKAQINIKRSPSPTARRSGSPVDIKQVRRSYSRSPQSD